MNHADGLRGIRMLIVEDEALIAEELRVRLSRLGAQIVATRDSAAAAVEAALETRPDVMLMDIRLRGPGDGVDVVRQVRARCDVAVVYVTAHSDRATLGRAKRAGVCAYVTKPFAERQLVAAIEMALHAHMLELGRAQRHRTVEGLVDHPAYDEVRQRYATLTARERAVFEQIASGQRNRTIAENLRITERTVKAHRAAVMAKMQAKSLAVLARSAFLLGLPV